jgi:hypothetical protein
MDTPPQPVEVFADILIKDPAVWTQDDRRAVRYFRRLAKRYGVTLPIRIEVGTEGTAPDGRSIFAAARCDGDSLYIHEQTIQWIWQEHAGSMLRSICLHEIAHALVGHAHEHDEAWWTCWMDISNGRWVDISAGFDKSVIVIEPQNYETPNKTKAICISS